MTTFETPSFKSEILATRNPETFSGEEVGSGELFALSVGLAAEGAAEGEFVVDGVCEG